MYRTARLYRLAKSIPSNRFLVSLNVNNTDFSCYLPVLKANSWTHNFVEGLIYVYNVYITNQFQITFAQGGRGWLEENQKTFVPITSKNSASALNFSNPLLSENSISTDMLFIFFLNFLDYIKASWAEYATMPPIRFFSMNLSINIVSHWLSIIR